MPKQTYKIQGFHGGINSDADPRDIKDFESPSSLDANIDSVGRVKLMGAVSAANGGNTSAILNNRGLFVMGSDRDLTGSDYTGVLIFKYDNDSTDADVGVNAKDAGSWHNDFIPFTDQITPVFYSADGVLRVGDSSYAEDSQWLGYISDERFNGLQADSGAIGWYPTNQDITTPILGKCLISTPSKLHVDTAGVNGGGQEYDHIANDTASRHQVMDTTSVNLRVGVQLKGMISGLMFLSDWTYHINCAITQETSTEKPYPFYGHNFLILADTANNNEVTGVANPTSAILNTYTVISDENHIAHPFYISSGREYNDLKNVEINWGKSESSEIEGQVYYSWKFKKEDIKPNCWNLLICTPANFDDTYDPETELMWGESWDYCKVVASRTTNNPSSLLGIDWKLGTPIRIENPGVIGYPQGDYSFHYTWLYDDEKQESLPFKFRGVDTERKFEDHTGGSNNTVFTHGSSSFVASDLIGQRVQNTTDGSEGYIRANASTTITVHDLQHGTDNDFDDNDDITLVPGAINQINVLGGYVLFNFDIYNNVNPSNSYSINKRITGARIYWKLDSNDDYFLVGEEDFIEKGFKWFPSSSKLAYDMQDPLDTSDNWVKYSALVKGVTPESANMVDTYRNINGFSPDVDSINAQYTTAVLHGRRVYIGNIKQDGEEHSDRILKSQINKFDTFPKDRNALDVAIRDGEIIIKLEAFADRILEFKQNSLFIINVSDNVNFLEDVYRNKGCAFDYHVTKTDYGIAWFNIHGVYFYDGKNVTNLLEKDGLRLINEADWEAFITDAEDGSADDGDMSSAHIGYIPKKRQLLIKNENTDVFLYDFVLRAWMKGSEKVTLASSVMTNFALDEDQDLFFLSSTDSDVHTWIPASKASSGFLYQTKDIDFGEPGVRKKVYKVYVTYKTAASGSAVSNVIVDYDVNGGTTFPYDFADGTNFASTELGFANGWQVAELKPDDSTEANNIKSFQLRFQVQSGQQVPVGFEINDISIIYRMKNIK